MENTQLNILVPTDFSEPANAALEYASKLASDSGGCITIFHGISIHVANSTEEAEFITTSELERIENEQLVQLRHQISKRYPKVQYDIVSKMGFPVELISDIVKERKTDLIVMGTRGASGMKEILVGSNTASLIHQTECPVLAVPEQTTFTGIKKIVFATNMQQDDINCLIKLIQLFGHKEDTSITLLHIEDGHARDPEAALQSWFHEAVLPKSLIRISKLKASVKLKSLKRYMNILVLTKLICW
ncbi:MAG: universal stress protein [Bacteroidetes bacterium]|nr:universal stress protein [Bacteroidota bacterium]